MKLEEAASILGLSLEDITMDGLKQTYRNLAMALDPEKCKDPTSRQRYQQISEAYKKLNSVMEGTDTAHVESAREIDAFMRMFMDMVGISENDTIPAGAEFSISHPSMTFGMGMMFGSRQNSMDEWSTDDEGEYDDDEDEEEDDEDDDDYMHDEYYEEYAASIGYGPNGHYINPRNSSPIFPLPPPPPHFEHHHRSGGSNGSYNGRKMEQATKPVVGSMPPDESDWEPAAKQYSNMNLKAQVSQERAHAASETNGSLTSGKSNAHKGGGVASGDAAVDGEQSMDGAEEQLTEAEKEKKLKAARKRAEKRKKQKEKKQREAQNKLENEVENEAILENDETDAATAIDAGVPVEDKEEKVEVTSPLEQLGNIVDMGEHDHEEYNRLMEASKDFILMELSTAVTNGQLGKVNQLLSYDFSDELPSTVSSELINMVKEALPTMALLHRCVTDFFPEKRFILDSDGSKSTDGVRKKKSNSTIIQSTEAKAISTSGKAEAELSHQQIAAIGARRLEVAKYLLNFRSPSFDLGVLENGLSILHHAVFSGDAQVAHVVIRAITEGSTDRKSQLNLNSRCHRKGWAPIHYAVDVGSIECLKLLIQSGANLSATVATDKRWTPMELARLKVKTASEELKPAAQSLMEELQIGIDRVKAAKKGENAHPGGSLTFSSSAGSKDVGTSNIRESTVSGLPKTGKEQTLEPSISQLAAEISTTGPSTTTVEKKKKGKQQQQSPQQQKQGSTSNQKSTVQPAQQHDTQKKKTKDANFKESSADHGKKESVGKAVSPERNEKIADRTLKEKKELLSDKTVDKKTKPKDEDTTVKEKDSVSDAQKSKGKGEGNASKLSKRQQKKAAATAAKQASASLNPAEEMNVSSRDEMADRLLAMGFSEADCLTAISLYGTDVDQAISWLCERPVPDDNTIAVPAAGASTSSTNASVGQKKNCAKPGSVSDSSGANSSRGNKSSSKSTSSSSTTAPTVSGPAIANPSVSSIPTNSTAAAAASSATTTTSQAAKMQKEKEELRRINRAWNQKAEDEKRKLELQRREAEEQKQKELAQQKKLQEQQQQQQLQQQLLYQQHLQQQQQQFVLMQQQHQLFQQQRQFGLMNMQNPANIAVNLNMFQKQQLDQSQKQMLQGGGLSASVPTINNLQAPNSADVIGTATASAPQLSGVDASLRTSLPLPYTSGVNFNASTNGVGVSTFSQPAVGHNVMMNSVGANTSLSGEVVQGSSSVTTGLFQQMSSSQISSNITTAINANSTQSPLINIPTADWNNTGSLSGPLDFSFANASGSHDAISSSLDGINQAEDVVNGAVELSAIAKPFVPKFSSPSVTGMTAPPNSSPPGFELHGQANNSFATSDGLPQPSQIGTTDVNTNSGSPWLPASTIDITSALPAIASLPPSYESGRSPKDAPRFLSSLLPSDLNLDDYGDDTDMPDLDSFLPDDLK